MPSTPTTTQPSFTTAGRTLHPNTPWKSRSVDLKRIGRSQPRRLGPGSCASHDDRGRGAHPNASGGGLGVPRWQHDLWYRIVSAALDGHPAQVDLADIAGLDVPAVSRYGATTPALLRWFEPYNAGRPYREQVRPFAFLLAFQAQSLPETQGGSEGTPTVGRGRSKVASQVLSRWLVPYLGTLYFDRTTVRQPNRGAAESPTFELLCCHISQAKPYEVGRVLRVKHSPAFRPCRRRASRLGSRSRCI